MSKFEYGPFITDVGVVIAFNAQKYSKAQAMELAVRELDVKGQDELYYTPACCYCGFGVDDDGEKCHGYWLTRESKKNSFPVMVFSVRGREWY